MSELLERYSDFLGHFQSRIPSDVSDSFTDEQLEGVVRAFGDRKWGQHGIDIRRSIPLLFGRAYFVFLAGSEQRTTERLRLDSVRHRFWRLSNAILVTLFIVMVIATAFSGMYGFKSVFGIDLFPFFDVLPDEDIQGIFKQVVE